MLYDRFYYKFDDKKICIISQNITFISKDEYFFKGHFPDNPIVPGVIIVEAMAQTAGIVVSYKFKDFKEKSTRYI